MPALPGEVRGNFEIANHNKLLANYPGAIGVKTGFTSQARSTFVGAASRDGRTLVVALMHTGSAAWRDAAALMDWGFAHGAAIRPVGELVDPLPPVPTKGPAWPCSANGRSPKVARPRPARVAGRLQAGAVRCRTPRTPAASGRAGARGRRRRRANAPPGRRRVARARRPPPFAALTPASGAGLRIWKIRLGRASASSTLDRRPAPGPAHLPRWTAGQLPAQRIFHVRPPASSRPSASSTLDRRPAPGPAHLHVVREERALSTDVARGLDL